MHIYKKGGGKDARENNFFLYFGLVTIKNDSKGTKETVAQFLVFTGRTNRDQPCRDLSFPKANSLLRYSTTPIHTQRKKTAYKMTRSP